MPWSSGCAHGKVVQVISFHRRGGDVGHGSGVAGICGGIYGGIYGGLYGRNGPTTRGSMRSHLRAAAQPQFGQVVTAGTGVPLAIATVPRWSQFEHSHSMV